jgi:hypothetical protein
MKLERNILGILLLLTILAPAVAFAGTSGPSPIPAPPNFQVSTNVLTLCKGIINRVPIDVKTPAGAAVMQSTLLGISNSKYTYTAGNGTVTTVNVTPNVTQVITLPIFVSLNATPLITTGISINYVYDTFYSDSEVRNISFGIESCPSQLSLSVIPPVLTSGKIENLTINLNNTGSTQLNFISIHGAIPSQDGTFLGIQPVLVNNIAPHSSKSVSESVFVYRNATQSFPVNFSINMYNGTNLEQVSYNPILLSTGIINISSSSLTISPTNPTPGSIFSISFVLTDVGTSSASAVTAEALSPQGFSSYGSNSVFVGDMQTDTQTPVTITLSTQNTLKAGNYTIPVRISYLNSLRQNQSTLLEIPVTMSAAFAANGIGSGRTYHKSSGGGLLIIVIIIIVIIVAAFLYLRSRKPKSK